MQACQYYLEVPLHQQFLTQAVMALHRSCMRHVLYRHAQTTQECDCTALAASCPGKRSSASQLHEACFMQSCQHDLKVRLHLQLLAQGTMA